MRSWLARFATIAAGLLVVACASAPSPSTITTPTPTASPDDTAPSTWTPTGDMVTPRHGHTATLLRDGKVLVAGGGSGAASAQLHGPPKR